MHRESSGWDVRKTDSSCAILLISAVSDTGDIGVKVAQEVVEEAHPAVLPVAATSG
jgi:hypothetical protein